MKSLRIGSLELKSPVIAAPLAGVSDAAFRYMAIRYGAGMVVSEMVNARALIERDKKTKTLLAGHPDARPYSIQLFGHNASELEAAAGIVSAMGADSVDLNTGCPVKKILRSGSGGALSKDMAKFAEVISSMRRGATIPFTVKIRAGFDDKSPGAVEMAKIVEGCGADAVAVHARYVKEGFMGKARWNIIRDVVEAVKIPVIGNGDIVTAADAARMVSETGCAGVMIGRGAMGNPYLFREASAAIQGLPIPEPPTPQERFETALTQYDLMVQYSPRVAVRHWRKHLSWYARGLPGAADFRNAVFKIHDPEELRKLAVEFFCSRYGATEPARP